MGLSGDTLKRITKAALGGLASCALILGGTQVAVGALSETLKVTDALTDLLTNNSDGPFDGTRAKTTVALTTEGTKFTIRVTGIDPSSVPDEGVGAHLHVGPCDDDPTTTVIEGPGPHFNTDVVAGISPPSVSTETEVWFDLVPDEEGMAYDQTSVDFVPVDQDGEMSIVIHEGIASVSSTKQACFPLSVSGIFPTA